MAERDLGESPAASSDDNDDLSPDRLMTQPQSILRSPRIAQTQKSIQDRVKSWLAPKSQRPAVAEVVVAKNNRESAAADNTNNSANSSEENEDDGSPETQPKPFTYDPSKRKLRLASKTVLFRDAPTSPRIPLQRRSPMVSRKCSTPSRGNLFMTRAEDDSSLTLATQPEPALNVAKDNGEDRGKDQEEGESAINGDSERQDRNGNSVAVNAVVVDTEATEAGGDEVEVIVTAGSATKASAAARSSQSAQPRKRRAERAGISGPKKRNKPQASSNTTPESAASVNNEGHDEKTASPAAGTSQPASAYAAERFARDPLVWEGAPDDTSVQFPPGWVKRKFQRQEGATKGREDSYWYTPIEGYKLRSVKQVQRFLEALNQCDGNEAAARKRMKSG